MIFTIEDPPNVYPPQSFLLSAEVQNIVSFDPPRIVTGEIDRREGRHLSLAITGKGTTFAVLSAEPSSPYVQITLGESQQITVGEEHRTRIQAHLLVGKDAPIGHLDGTIAITTNEPQAAKMVYTVAAEVLGDARVNPSKVSVTANGTGTPFSKLLRIDGRAGTPLKITSIEFDARKDMHLAADVAPMDGGKYYMLTLSGVSPESPGMFNGSVTIMTDSGGTPETIRIPIYLAVPARGSTQPAKQAAPPPAAQPATLH